MYQKKFLNEIKIGLKITCPKSYSYYFLCAIKAYIFQCKRIVLDKKVKFQKLSFRKYYHIDFSFLAFMDLLEVKTKYIADTYALCVYNI